MVETSRVTVVARFKAQAGKEQQLMNELTALVAPTVKEPGCINYDLHRSGDDPALFLLHENWCSRQDLDDHLARPHLQAFLGRSGELLAEPIDLSLWKIID